MRKTLSLLVIVSIFLGGGLYFFIPSPSLHFPLNGYCAFCDPSIVNHQNFYEDDLVCALYTHKPILPGHCLIIPKRHVERFELLTSEEIAQIGNVIKKVNLAVMEVFGTSSYLLLQKNGLDVGQTVPHVHFHYVPRKSGDNSVLQFIIKMFTANIKPAISKKEMRETIEKLKQAMTETPFSKE